MTKAAVLLLLAAAGGAVGAGKAHCGGDNCARQVTGTRPGLTPLSSRRADCLSFMQSTVVPEATTVTVTVTVEPDEEPAPTPTPTTTATGTTTCGVECGAASETPHAVPAYASACKQDRKYSSACSCWGITAGLTTAPVPTETRTVTVTLDFCEEDL
ncbi:hypothetical protein E4U41_004299 [Claviceps citrina]|nr:hypothetical protein E4U41_004299 [Claviceps citrina]